MTRSTIARRGFLRGLAGLPLIGGSVSLIGEPVAAAVPVTLDLMHSYKSWLFMEHKMLSHELVGYEPEGARRMEATFLNGSPGDEWHFQWPNPSHRLAGWREAPQPSTRAAVILSAAGVSIADALR